jgi:hypothetical protein
VEVRNPDHGLAGLQIAIQWRHLFLGQIPEAGEDHQQIRRVQRFHAGNVLHVGRVDQARARIDREEHGAGEAMLRGEDLRQLRERFLRAVLLIARDEDDVLALAGALAACIDHPRITRGVGRCGAQSQEAA